MRQLQLIVEPHDGAAPVLEAIRHARKSLDITLFRFNHRDIASALRAAVARGVKVRALIAHANHKGVHDLRRLELRLLEAGVTVTRTSDDYPRYHAKIMIVDGRALHVHAFNCTALDLRSRSFGIISTDARVVRCASRLFESDLMHQPFSPGPSDLVVSPENARDRLEAFLRGARRELLIYDSKLNDQHIIRLLQERAEAFVDVRIIGHLGKSAPLRVEKLRNHRLHLRAIVRDNSMAFVGSQSLSRSELDSRREVGIFVSDPTVVREIRDTFERDWRSSTGLRMERPVASALKVAL